jgi:hypothetical protein
LAPAAIQSDLVNSGIKANAPPELPGRGATKAKDDVDQMRFS